MMTEAQHDEYVNGPMTPSEITRLTQRLSNLTSKYWHYHYSDDDVRADQLRCEIEELQYILREETSR